MVGINGWEFLILGVLAVFLLGDRMPEYAAKLARLIRDLRLMAERARGQLRDQMGPEFDDIDWRQYDPRQYDPRRIVREALMEPLDEVTRPVRDEVAGIGAAVRGRSTGTNADPDLPDPSYEAEPDPGRVRPRVTPYDTDAT